MSGKPNYKSQDLFYKVLPCKKDVGRVMKTSLEPERNTFEEMRPSLGYAIDYNISQTYCKFDAGNKKISFRQTQATYVTPKKNTTTMKKRYFHGRPPFFEYLDEVRDRKFEKEQKKQVEMLNIAKRNAKIQYHQLHKSKHACLQQLCGPEWFQELSPAQMEAIEKLKICIDTDLFCDTIVRCQEVISKLGLVLRPNPRHIKNALLRCGGSPEEFLLQLYSLINPKRTGYSINDRLLISSVVHLSMENTLRELHVRIPSPPKETPANKSKKKEVKPQKKKSKPISPYLEQVVFKPHKKKKCAFTRIYRPNIPYFSYIPRMRYEIKHNNGYNYIDTDLIPDPKEAEIIQETIAAQQLYNEKTNSNKVYLLKPSYMSDPFFLESITNASQDEPPVKEKKKNVTRVSHDDSTVREKKKNPDDSTKPRKKGNSGTTTKPPTAKRKKSTKNSVSRKSEAIDEEIQFDFCDKISVKSTCEVKCMECIGLSKEEGTISMCVTGNPKLPPATLQIPDSCDCYVPNTLATPIMGGCKMTPSGHMIPFIQGIRQNKCECLEHFYEQLKVCEEEKSFTKAKMELKKLPNKYQIQGVVCTPDGPVFILGGIVSGLSYGPPGATLDYYRKELVNFDINDLGNMPNATETKVSKCKIREKPNECECKKKSEKFIKKQCRCEKCKVIDRRNNPFFISGGSVETEQGLVPIIGGICIRTCDCLQKYLDNIRKFEYRKIIKEGKKKLKENIGVRPIIQGVTITPDGPVYNIGGMKQKSSCKCLEVYLDKIEEMNKRIPNYVDDDYFTLLENPPEKAKICSKECRICKQHYEKFISKQCRCQKCETERRLQDGTFVIAGSQVDPYGTLTNVIGGVQLPTCSCLKDYQDRLHDYECGLLTRDKMKQLKKQNMIIGGVTQGKDSPEYIISGLFAGDGRNPYIEDDKEFIISPEDKEIMEVCKCRPHLEKYFSMKCRCEKCKEERRKENEIKAYRLKQKEMSSVQNTTEETTNEFGDYDPDNYQNDYQSPIYSDYDTGYDYNYGYGQETELIEEPIQEVDSDVYGETKCQCLKMYTEKLKFYEDYKKRIAAVVRLKSKSNKYIVGGVVNSPDGPVYLISGVRQEPDCKCAAMIKKQLEEEHMMAMMPQPPKGRVTYHICGVKETDQGNVFILSNAKYIEECPCMDMFRRFENAHAFCTDFYTNYLTQMLNYINEYLLELDKQKEIFREEKELENIEKKQQSIRNFIEETKKLIRDNELFMDDPIVPTLKFEVNPDTLYHCKQDERSNEEHEGEEDQGPEDQPFEEPPEDKPQNPSNHSQENDVIPPDSSNEKPVLPKKQSKRTKPRIKGVASKPKKEEVISAPEPIDISDVEIKRFFIIKKFPKSYSKQENLLKAALLSLQEDGFHIAKLPDCHKLPHFKIWLQMRSGVTWTSKDIIKFWNVSKDLTNLHIAKCYARVEMENPLTVEQMRRATWADSDYYKALIDKTRFDFYRKIKQSLIENSREFFPSLFLYQFYSERIRNAFFSLSPSKEEEIYPFKIIRPHELKLKK